MARSNRKHANARRTPQRSEMDSRPQPDSSSLAAQRAQAPSEAQTDSRNMSATTSEKPAGPAIVVSPGNAASPAAEPRLTYAMRAKLGVMKKDSAPAPARPLSSTASVASAASLVTSPPPTTPPAPSTLAASPKSEVMSKEALVTPPAKPALAVLVSVEPSTVTADDTTATTPTQASTLLSPVSPTDSDGDGALVSSLSMPSLSAASSRTSLMSVDELLSPRDSYDSPPPAAVFRKFYRDRVEGDRPAASMSASETPESNMATITVSLPTPKRAHSQVASRPPTPPVEEMQFASLNDPPAMDYSVFDQFDGAVAIYCPYPDDHLRHDSFYYQPRLTFEVPTQLSRDPSPAQQQQYAPPEHEQQQHVYAPPHHNGVYGWEMAPHHIQQQQQQWCYVPVASGPPPGDMGVPPPAPYPMQAPDQAQYHQAPQQPNGAAPPPAPAPFVPAPAGPMRQGSFQQQQKQQGPQQQQQQQQQPPPMRPPYGQQHSQGRPSYNRGNSGSSAGGHAYGGRQQGWGPGPNNRGRGGGGGGGGGRQFGNGGGRGGGFGRDREGAGGWRDGPGPLNANGNGSRRDDGERGNAYDTRGPRNGRENGQNDAAGPPPAPAPAPAATQTAPPRT